IFSRDWSSDVCSSDLELLLVWALLLEERLGLNWARPLQSGPVGTRHIRRFGGRLPGGLNLLFITLPRTLELTQLLQLWLLEVTRSEERREGKAGRTRC